MRLSFSLSLFFLYKGSEAQILNKKPFQDPIEARMVPDRLEARTGGSKGKGSSVPSRVPSSVPSNIPSRRPSSMPSSEPSSMPTCIDDTDWTMPRISDFFETPFTGKTCQELEAYTTPENRDQWCSYLSTDLNKEKCVAEACCFCGGGSDLDIPCEDIPGWQLGPNVGCDFVAASPDPTSFCEDVKDFVYNGQKASDSCCVCGGGTKPQGHYSLPRKSSARMLGNEDEPTGASEEDKLKYCDGDDCSVSYQFDKRDWTTREGLGESPGVPNLEYLGLGYDAFRGNPRGSLNSEVDPGKWLSCFNHYSLPCTSVLNSFHYLWWY